MNNVYLLLGSNMGNRLFNLSYATAMIDSVSHIAVDCGSAVFKTAPWGFTHQNWFYNQALRIYTTMHPVPLLRKLKQIEKDAGRKPGEKWHARLIDIDILFYNQDSFLSPNLNIPHLFFHERRFAMACMNDIAPEFYHKKYGMPISALLERCTDNSTIYKLQ